MAISIQVRGADKLRAVGNRYLNARAEIRELLGKAGGAFANDTVSDIRKNYLSGPRPEILGVVTNRLRSSIRYRIENASDEMKIVFGTDVPYAKFHELYGVGKKLKKRPFLRPGVEDNFPKFEARVLKVIKDVSLGAFNG